MSVELFATTAFDLTVACTERAAGGFRRRRAPPGRRVRRGCSGAKHRHPCQAFLLGIVPYRELVTVTPMSYARVRSICSVLLLTRRCKAILAPRRWLLIHRRPLLATTLTSFQYN